LKSTSGTEFDGVTFGGTAVYFPKIRDRSFTGMTLSFSSAVRTVLVTGLTANNSYRINIQSNGNDKEVTIAPNAQGLKADSAGVLRLTM
jgi:hypothetical protein